LLGDDRRAYAWRRTRMASMRRRGFSIGGIASVWKMLADVVLDGPLCLVEGLGDRFVGVAFSHVCHHFPLAWRQLVEWCARRLGAE
jgi:hypothetical protein